MELRFMLIELLLVACIFLPVSAEYVIYCDPSDDNTICSITITPSMKEVTLNLTQSARTVRCISCETQTMPRSYYDEKKVALLHKIDFSKSRIKFVRLHKDMWNPDSLILFNVSHNEISKLNDDSLFQRAGQLLTIDLSYNRIHSLSKNVFNRFVTLQTINLSFNAIEELDEIIFSNLADLKILKINNNKLRSLRNLFGKTVSLEHLDVSFNNIESLNTTTLKETKKLIILDLSSNALTTLNPSTFSEMAQLQVLRLTNNKLQQINTKLLLDRIPNLSHLYVNQNRLTEMHLSDATKLHTIHASDNNITLAIFISMASLEVLDVSRNNLSDLVLLDLLALRQVKVDHNNLSSIEMVCSALPVKLNSLDLAYNHLNDINATTFERFEDLQFLNLRQSGLNRIDASTFSGLKNVRTLDISYNKLKDFDLKYLRNQRELTELYLDGNGLSSMKKMNFSSINLPKLKRIGISDNDWRCTDLQQLLIQFALQGIKAHVDRHAPLIRCFSNYMLPSEVNVVEGATYATNQEDYLNGIENIDKLTNDDVERINKQVFEEFPKHIINEAKEIHRHSRTFIAVALCLVCIAIALLLISIVLLYKRNRTEGTCKMSNLQDL